MQREKYLEFKNKVDGVWQEVDRLREATAKLQTEPAKSAVNGLIAIFDEARILIGFQLRAMDAMLENGPRDGLAADGYDPKKSVRLISLTTEGVSMKLAESLAALDTIGKRMSDRLNSVNAEIEK